jgi:cell division protein FtsQ
VSADVQSLPYRARFPGVAEPRAPHVAPAGQGRTKQAKRCPPTQRRRLLPRRWRMRRALPLAVALTAAVVFWAATDGGSHARRPGPIIPHLDQLLDRVGLGLSEIAVTGQQMVSDRAIYERLNLAGTRSIWTVDTDAVRRRLETLPWIEMAALKRIFPDRLLVEITERQPIAIWRDVSRAFAVGASGRVLGEVDQSRFPRLAVVFGRNAAKEAATIITGVRRLPELAARVALFERVAERRWTLHLKSGRRVLLPADGQSHALVSLMQGRKPSRLIDLDFEVLDLRIASQPAIEMRKRGSG